MTNGFLEEELMFRINKQMERNLRKERIGVVSSNKMDKSIVVMVERKSKTSSSMGSSLRSLLSLFAHDEENTCNEGDTVKSWKLEN